MWLLECHKAPFSEHPLWINVFETRKHWRTLHGGYFILILHKSQKKSSWETSLLVRSEILGLFGNTLTADHMNSLHNRDKLPPHNQTALIPKQKTFSECFWDFRNLHKNLSIFETKASFIAQIFQKLLTPENMVTGIPESSRFRTHFVNQRVRGSQTLTNSA